MPNWANLHEMLDLESLRHQGEAAWGAGHWELAQATYAAIVEADPADQMASSRLVECVLALGSPDAASDVLEALLDRLESRGNLQGALAFTDSLLQLSVDPALALERSARLLFRLKDEAAALARLRQLSDSYLDRGQTEEAIGVFKRAQEAHPGCVDLGMELGHLYIALGYIDEGTEQFRALAHHALDHSVDDAMEAFRRWDFLKRLGQRPS